METRDEIIQAMFTNAVHHVSDESCFDAGQISALVSMLVELKAAICTASEPQKVAPRYDKPFEPRAMTKQLAWAAVRNEMARDDDLALGWHSNLAVMMTDAGVDYYDAQKRASQFMNMAFGRETLGLLMDLAARPIDAHMDFPNDEQIRKSIRETMQWTKQRIQDNDLKKG